MTIYFDNCTENLVKSIKTYKNKNSKAVNIYKVLPQLKKALINNEVCPKGEIERGYLCRQFLRELVRDTEKDITGSFTLDETMNSLLKTTRDYIESSKKETEENRAIIVLRNLLILKYNADHQKQKSGFSLNPSDLMKKPSLTLKFYNYDDETVGFLYNALGVNQPKLDEVYKKIDDKNVINSMGYNDYLLKRYKQIFVYTVVKSLESMEV